MSIVKMKTTSFPLASRRTLQIAQEFRIYWSIPHCVGVKSVLPFDLHSHPSNHLRYPVRDPFFKMLPRSLSNFMNAFTSADHTTYPFATTNHTDYRNLMSVYLDATLRPLLKKNDFIQEGWRIGPENPLEPMSDFSDQEKLAKLVFKGVVYNEMKGQMSDTSYLYYIRFQENMYPAINNSGGDPRKMTDLTYSGLKAFHTQNYHPSNAKLFTYGNMPLADHLEEITRRFEQFDRSQADKSIKQPLSFDSGPTNIIIQGPLDPLVDQERQHITSTSWQTANVSNVVDSFPLQVLSTLLLTGYGSPLYKSLIESGLGTDWSPNTGFDTAGFIGVFTIGATGVREADVSKVKQTMDSTLRNVVKYGFEKQKVEGLLHQLELSLKHESANFGMGLMQRLQSGWFNGTDPLAALAWNNIVSDFKQKYAQGGFLEGLIEKYLLNDRNLTFTMEPTPDYGQQLVEDEKTRLQEKIKQVSSASGGDAKAVELLTEQEKELLRAQEIAPNEDLSSLPTVHVSDIPRSKPSKPVRDLDMDGIRLQLRETTTNGLTYFRAIHTFDNMPQELRVLIPLFTDCLLRLGTKNRSMEQLEDLIKLRTGGISASHSSSALPTDIITASEGLSFSGYCLDHNIEAMFDLLRIIVQETDFDNPEAESKIFELLQSDAGGALNSVASSGHAYARRAAEAALTPSAMISEQTAGLTQVGHTAVLASRPREDGLKDVIAKLKTIQAAALSRSTSLRAAITCGPEAVQANESALTSFLSNFPSSIPTFPTNNTLLPAQVESKLFIPLPYQVYYSALALPTVPYTDPSSGPLDVLAQLLTHKHLHHEIREKGGAYGGGASHKGLSGLFGYYSYRDPNPQNTLRIMQDAGRWARDKDWTANHINEAKLSVFQGVDAPKSVSEEGMVRFLSGIDEKMQQERRERLLDVTKEQVVEAAHRFLVDGAEKAVIAVIGEKNEWAKECEGWNIRSMDMLSIKEGQEEQEDRTSRKH